MIFWDSHRFKFVTQFDQKENLCVYVDISLILLKYNSKNNALKKENNENVSHRKKNIIWGLGPNISLSLCLNCFAKYDALHRHLGHE